MLISFCLYFHFTINHIGWYYYIFSYEHPCNTSKDNEHGDSNVFCTSKLKTASYSIHQPLPLFPCLIVLTITAHQLSEIGRMRKTSSRTMNPVLLDLLLQKSARATMRLVSTCLTHFCLNQYFQTASCCLFSGSQINLVGCNQFLFKNT